MNPTDPSEGKTASNIATRVMEISDSMTRGPWKVAVDTHPFTFGPDHLRQSKHTEYRIATEWIHGQLKGPMPIVTQSVGLGYGEGGKPIHMVSMRKEDAEGIVELRNIAPELARENQALRDEVERLRTEKRPFSDKLAGEVIAGQVKRITELENKLTALRQAAEGARVALEKADQIIKQFTGDGRSHCVIDKTLAELRARLDGSPDRQSPAHG